MYCSKCLLPPAEPSHAQDQRAAGPLNMEAFEQTLKCGIILGVFCVGGKLFYDQFGVILGYSLELILYYFRIVVKIILT